MYLRHPGQNVYFGIAFKGILEYVGEEIWLLKSSMIIIKDTGYEHPWVAPLLAECLYCGTKDGATTGPMEKGWVYRAWFDGNGVLQHEKDHPHPVCQGTGKRYPQLWERCWKHFSGARDGCSSCKGSGWIPRITTAGLWSIGNSLPKHRQAEFGRCLAQYEVPFGRTGVAFAIWWATLTEEQRMEALAKAIVAAEG